MKFTVVAVVAVFAASASSMKVAFPTVNKNLAVIHNIDVKRANEYDKV